MKSTKILFWTTTIIIFLFEGVMPALFSQTEMSKEGTRHLSYPDYFALILVVFKVAGALTLIIPKMPARIKEWAYAGFTFNFIFASLSHWAIDGFSFNVLFPLIILAILLASYFSYHKLTLAKAND